MSTIEIASEGPKPDTIFVNSGDAQPRPEYSRLRAAFTAMDSKSAPTRENRSLVGERLIPAALILHGPALLGAAFAGAAESSTASRAVGYAFPILPGATAGLLGGYATKTLGGPEWLLPLIFAGAMTLGLLLLVDRARQWPRWKGIPVLLILAILSGAQAAWLTLALRA